MLEDDAADADLVSYTLRRSGIVSSSERVDTPAGFARALEQGPPDVILSDYSLPSFDGYAALAIARDKCPDTPFIFVTGTLGEEVAIETLKRPSPAWPRKAGTWPCSMSPCPAAADWRCSKK